VDAGVVSHFGAMMGFPRQASLATLSAMVDFSRKVFLNMKNKLSTRITREVLLPSPCL
jgi:hypothetical protein